VIEKNKTMEAPVWINKDTWKYEFSDHAIRNKASEYSKIFKEEKYEQGFIDGCKWYRDQIKSKNFQ
jgi:hypothetical protein